MKLIEDIFAVSPEIRYVAVYRNGQLVSKSRGNLANESSGESDKYEELLANPTLLKLATQRGNIDCGGMEYLLVRYGNFFEWMQSIEGGHVSVGIESTADPLALVGPIRAVLPAGN
jgi:hypothetical protein